jgi:hypothetical protein
MTEEDALGFAITEVATDNRFSRRVQGQASGRAGLGANPAGGAVILVNNKAAVFPSHQGARGTGFDAGGLLAALADQRQAED